MTVSAPQPTIGTRGGANSVATAATSQEVVAFLRDRETYPEFDGDVEVCETHISWVFLTAKFAFKLKKPVQFEFLDWFSLESRRLACLEEVRLNRRLAADCYLGVLPIVRLSNGKLRLGGEGTAVDYVVYMRRLPADRMLDRLLCEHRLTSHDVAQVSEHLLSFYLAAPPLLQRPELYRERIEKHVRANRDALCSAPHIAPLLVERTHAAQLARLALYAGAFSDRACDGRIIEGHGDLRPEHVCLGARPSVFDCLEFSRELRELDVADELSFFAMECDRLGSSAVGHRVWNDYAAATRDAPPKWLLAFYRAYRACVRAKVAVLRAAQATAADAEQHYREANTYLELADSYRCGPAAPFLLVVRGLSGTGKSTLAAALAAQLGAALLRTDEIRKNSLGAKQPGGDWAPDAGEYAPEMRGRVYDELLRRARNLIGQGLSTVVDGTFLATAQRLAALDAATGEGARVLFVVCQCPAALARERIAERLKTGHDASDARPELLDEQVQRDEADPKGAVVCHVDTARLLVEQQARVIEALAAMYPDDAIED